MTNETKKPITLPHHKFAVAGISAQALDALPEDVKERLAEGQLSPLINIRFQYANGMAVELPVKLKLTSSIDGKEILLAYPVNKVFKNEQDLVNKAFKKLDRGWVLADAERYIQKDPETNCIITKDRKELRLEEKLREFEKVNDIELGLSQKQQFINGMPVELNVGGEKVVVGLDLRSPDSFRELKGNMKDWERQKEIEYDIAHPEYIGLVQTEENRWEYQQVIQKGQNARELHDRPAQTRNFSMGR